MERIWKVDIHDHVDGFGVWLVEARSAGAAVDVFSSTYGREVYTVTAFQVMPSLLAEIREFGRASYCMEHGGWRGWRAFNDVASSPPATVYGWEMSCGCSEVEVDEWSLEDV